MGAEYKNFCLTKSLLVKSVLWIEINPTLHIVLTHSPELMEENDNTGILNFTVGANNKAVSHQISKEYQPI